MSKTANEHSAGTPEYGLLLVGHGSREAAGVAEFLDTARRVEQLAPRPLVEPCFLEFERPTIGEGFARLAQRGARRIVAVPAALFAAGHVERDIPNALVEIGREHPAVTVAQAGHLGCQQRLVALSQWRYQQALAGRPPVSPQETMLVMIGRGSHEPRATAEMLEFSRLRQEQGEAGRVLTGFVAMAEPRLEQIVETAAASDVRRIVVQPHLLFAGVLLDRIGALVSRFAARHESMEWIVTAQLGDSELLARAILERAMATELAESRR